jgi:hypothetical protein
LERRKTSTIWKIEPLTNELAKMYTIHYIDERDEGKPIRYIEGGLQMIEILIRQGATIIKCVVASTGKDVTERIRGDFIQPLDALAHDSD